MSAVTLVVGGVPHPFEVRASSGQSVPAEQSSAPAVILDESTWVQLGDGRRAELVLDEDRLGQAAAWFALANPVTGFLPEATAQIEAATREGVAAEDIILPGGFYRVTAIE